MDFKQRVKLAVGRVRQMMEPPIKQENITDYAAYLKTQREGYAAKINTVFVREENIVAIANYALSRSPVRSVLCHGTRNGAEQRFFQSAIGGASVLGTEVGNGASAFPNTIEWDFHDVKPEWVGGWDLIYSNSWDHAAYPERAFKAWASCLSPNGLLVLEHTELHTVRHVRGLDPFGASYQGLIRFADNTLSPGHRVIHELAPLPFHENDQRAIVIGKC